MERPTYAQLTREELEGLRELVPTVRQKFAERFADDINAGSYSEKDIERLRITDKFVHRFIVHNSGDVEKTILQIDNSLKFRKEFGVNELTESSFPRELHELGAIFYHGHDRSGFPLLIFKVSKGRRDPEWNAVLKQFMVWWIDKHWLANPEQKMVAILDMKDATLRNVDLDIMKFQVHCFTAYFPAILEYMLIFEMPWVLNVLSRPIWKIVKGLLTSSQQQSVKFVKKTDITDYISPDQLIHELGGTDPFKYKYTPRNSMHITTPQPIPVSGGAGSIPSINGDLSPTSAFLKHSPGKKKHVSFAQSTSEHHYNEDRVFPPAAAKTSASSWHAGPLLNIRPADILVFIVIDDKKDSVDTLTLQNKIDGFVAYKVKTTAPDRYRVRPAVGVIKPNSSADLQVFLQPGLSPDVSKDKFLVMSQKVDSIIASSKVNELFRSPGTSKGQYEHKIRCVIEHAAPPEALPKGNLGELLLMQRHISDLANKDIWLMPNCHHEKPGSVKKKKMSMDPEKQPLCNACSYPYQEIDQLLDDNKKSRRKMQYLVVTQLLIVSCFIGVIFALSVAYYSDHPVLTRLLGPTELGQSCLYCSDAPKL